MKIIAISGGVASGKNTICDIILSNFKAEIFDADKINHEILKKSEIIAKIAEILPNAVENNEINRQKMAKIIFSDKNKLTKIEEVLHFEIQKKYQEILKNAKNNKKDFLILNIPLLLEKNNYHYDYLISVVSNFDLRKKRFVKRQILKENLENSAKNQEKFAEIFENIVKNQINDEIRIKKSDFLIKNDENNDLNDIKNQILAIFQEIN